MPFPRIHPCPWTQWFSPSSHTATSVSDWGQFSFKWKLLKPAQNLRVDSAFNYAVSYLTHPQMLLISLRFSRCISARQRLERTSSAMASASVPRADRTNNVTFSQSALPEPLAILRYTEQRFLLPGRWKKKLADAKPHINTKYSGLQTEEDTDVN